MKKPKKNPRGHFVMIYEDMTKSAAWKSLDGNAQALYMHIAARYNSKNNGKISFSSREAAPAINVSKATAARAFNNLIRRMLIEVAKHSGFNLKSGQGRAAEYRLTEHPCNVTGQPATYKFKKWRRAKNGAKGFFPGPTRRTDRSHQKDRGTPGDPDRATESLENRASGD
jgi:hypothetical protein